MCGHDAATIAVCMIVKNGASTIERAIDSVLPYVDEIDVYDTGSTDGTPEIVERINARVDCAADVRIVRGEWRDSFAWAREQSFAMASENVTWLIYLDADEEIVGAWELPVIARELPPEVDLVFFYWDIDRDAGGNTVTAMWRDRMVRRAAGYRWSGAAHTALVPPAGRVPVTSAVSRERMYFLHHRASGRWHPSRALKLLSAELERVGIKNASPNTLYNLANEHFWRGDFARASELYERFVEASAVRPAAERAHATYHLATAVRASGDAERARELELATYRELPDWPETLVGLMEASVALDDYPRAAQWARRAIAKGLPRISPIRDPLRLRVLPRLRLAEALLKSGDLDGAVFHVAAVERAAKGDPSVKARVDAFTDAVVESDIAGARRILRELVGRYDEVTQARIRQLWLESDPTLDADDVTIAVRQ